MGLRPKWRTNFCHPVHLKTARRAATSQLYESSFMVFFGRDLLLFILSIKKAIGPIGTFEVTDLAVVAPDLELLSLSIHMHRRYTTGIFLKVRHKYFRFGCTHEFPPSMGASSSSSSSSRSFPFCLDMLSTFPKKKGKPWLSASSPASNTMMKFFLISSWENWLNGR